MSTLKPARGSRSCRHVEPGASRLHSELSRRPMSPSTVDSTSTVHPSIKRATNALLIATFSHMHHLDQRRATCPRYPQQSRQSDEPRALQTGRGKDHPGGRPRGQQDARVVLAGPQRAMDGSDAAGAGMRRWRANLSQSGIRRASRPFHRRCSPLGALLVKKIARADAHRGPLQL